MMEYEDIPSSIHYDVQSVEMAVEENNLTSQAEAWERVKAFFKMAEPVDYCLDCGSPINGGHGQCRFPIGDGDGET